MTYYRNFETLCFLNCRDRGATLRLGGRRRVGTISDSILGGTKHFFLLTLYKFKNIGGGGNHSKSTFKHNKTIIFVRLFHMPITQPSF